MHGGEHDDDGELADGNEVDGEHADDNEGGESAGSATVTLVDDTEEEGVADVSHEVRGLGDRESRVRSPGSLDVRGEGWEPSHLSRGKQCHCWVRRNVY